MMVTPFLDWPAGLTLVLASASPRRAELLKVAGIPFEVIPAGEVEPERVTGGGELRADPVRYATGLAGAKAAAVAARFPDRLVLGADTVVCLDGRIFEKPTDRQDAARILGVLSGQVHRVVTGIVLLGGPFRPQWTGHEQTRVEFLPLTAEAIERYVDTAEPMDKAGAYGIQGYGALMVRRIEGCYFNVMGLPLARLGHGLRTVLGSPGPVPQGGK